MKIIVSELPSPLGALLLASDASGAVRALDFRERSTRLQRHLREHYGACDVGTGRGPTRVLDALRRYFEGELDAISTVDVITAGTPQQQLAWAALRRIPAGRTAAYGAIGKAMGITDWRASVDGGAAVGANPVALIVPCHRVLGAHGDLKGYAWGLHRKRWLLEHEGALAAQPAVPETGALF